MFVQKVNLFLWKSTKTVATRAAPFGPDMHQFVGWGLQSSPDPLAGSGGGEPGQGEGGRAVAKGWGWDWRGREGKEGEGRKGIRSLWNLTSIFRYNFVNVLKTFFTDSKIADVYFLLFFVLYCNSSSDFHYSDILILTVLKIKPLSVSVYLSTL